MAVSSPRLPVVFPPCQRPNPIFSQGRLPYGIELTLTAFHVITSAKAQVQVESPSEILGARTPTYDCGGHNSTRDKSDWLLQGT